MPANVCFISGWMYIPHARLSESEAARLLTVTPKQMAADKLPTPLPIYATDIEGMVGVPIDWGFSYLPDDVPVYDDTSEGFPITCRKLPDPNHPSAPEGQEQFVEEMYAAACSDHTLLCKAGTGCGKTIAALLVAMRLGRTTIVMLPTHAILDQWDAELKEKFGFKANEIGHVYGDKCEYEGKKVVLAMMHSLSMRYYDDAFYQYFGTAIWDEVHRASTPLLSLTIGQFAARVKIGLTATVERKDGGDLAYRLYFGEVKVLSTQRMLPCEIRPIRFRSTQVVWGEDRNQLIMCVTRDYRRNNLIAEKIKEMYETGGHILAVSESIDHIELMIERLVIMGIPREDIGQFTNQHTDSTKRKRVATPKARLKFIKSKDGPRIVMGTYGMLKEGVDIPRLSMGIDMTPRADFVQLVGRIRRRFPGKKLAIWYTILDVVIGQFMGYYSSRLKDVRGDPDIHVRADP